MKSENVAGASIPILQGYPRPVFIVGMNGSGTSMLADCLGRHPDLYATSRETRVIPDLIATSDNLGSLKSDTKFLKLWNRVRRIPAIKEMNNGEVPPLPSNWRDFPRDIPSVLDAVFRYLAMRHGKVRWGEKTPQHVQHIEQLHVLFPGAKFIHIIRDGRDCTASFHRRWGRTPELTIYRWKKVVHEGQIQGLRIGSSYLELKYEDIASAPEYWMHRICEFLNLQYNDAILVSRHPQRDDRGTLGRIEPNSGKWRRYFSKYTKIRLESIAGKFLHETGYSVENYMGDKDPSSLQRNFWVTRDYCRQMLYMISGKIRGDRSRSWTRIASGIPITLRQFRRNRY